MDTFVDQAFLVIMTIVSLIASLGLARALTTLWQQHHTPPSSD